MARSRVRLFAGQHDVDGIAGMTVAGLGAAIEIREVSVSVSDIWRRSYPACQGVD
jgi:hypothetical protein